jgi:signal peptidase I
VARSLSVKTFAGAIAVTALFVVCLSALAWRLDGGRWFVVRTPSMGQAAPVGTLLLTKPTTVVAVRVGDIITFRAPTSGVVYTHRVVSKTPTGLQTRGDINAVADPWVVTDANLVGRVAHRWWGCGWILRGLPLILLGLAVLWVVTAFVGPTWRSPLRVVGAALSVAGVATYLHPWVGLERLTMTTTDQGPVIRAVSVGVLPVSASPAGGPSTGRLVNGHVADIQLTHADANGSYNVAAHLDLPWTWWVAIALGCLVPLLWTLIVGLEPVAVPDDRSDDADVVAVAAGA